MDKTIKTLIKIFVVCVAYLIMTAETECQVTPKQLADTVGRAKNTLQPRISSTEQGLELTIKNVDITKYPDVQLILEAFKTNGEPVDTLYAEQMHVIENGEEKKIISVKKISINERVPVDFVFVLDKTGTMQRNMDGIQENIVKFTNTLMSRGIDFKIGLVLYSDIVENVFQPTDNVYTFINWIKTVKASGGNDEKENSLEALKFASKINFRPAANKVLVLITDAPFHQKGENGDGVTDQTTLTITESMKKKDLRLFAIVPPKLKEYSYMTSETSGKIFDIEFPFSTILNNFSTQLTNLYALKYTTNMPAIPDSLNISILNEKKEELIRKTVPIVELGRKMIIDNLLYKFGTSDLPDHVPELEILLEYMQNKPAVRVLVEGHTDNIGSHVFNDRLSKQRAESVKTYLVSKGIAASRIETAGFGKRRPIASNNTEFGRRLNRRTEIITIAK